MKYILFAMSKEESIFRKGKELTDSTVKKGFIFLEANIRVLAIRFMKKSTNPTIETNFFFRVLDPNEIRGKNI